ncbi:hypothetical protein DAETH_30780 [Deinococcus aetherius]|uniref:Uncharacterized protein n=1 Tax=Deinococcus aetherius TaxID=200252 RepID=A0ABM8AH28_9DEIO|nr:hypothetical protein DAETH_30780 [Deinococcus aetherius]
MLALGGNKVVGHAQQAHEFDVEARFLVCLAHRRLLQGLHELHLAARDAPAARLRGPPAEGEQNLTGIVEDQHADAHTGRAG